MSGSWTLARHASTDETAKNFGGGEYNHIFLIPFYVQSILILPAALDPGVYSASNTNEYRKHKKKMFLGSKVRLVRGADNLTGIYELIV
jgi:hypothetical protein